MPPKSYKVAVLTRRNPLDKRAWSGTMHYIYKSLKNNVGEVVLLGPYHPKLIVFAVKLYRKLIRIILRKNYNIAYSGWFIRITGRHFTKKIIKTQPDVIVAVSSTPYTTHLKNISVPIILVDDINFAQLIGYYPNFSNLLQSSLDKGQKITNMAYNKAAAIVFSSEWSKYSTIQEYGIPQNKISVIPFGANLDLIPDRQVALNKKFNDECKLLFLGVDWYRKGGPIAFETLQILLRAGVKATLTVCGTTPPAEFKNEKMKVIPFLNKNIPTDSEKLYRIFLETHFLIVPTRADCTPIVFCEANAFGIPVLTTQTGGIASVIETGVNGILHDLDDTGMEYAETIKKYYMGHDAYRKLVENSRLRFENRLNWDSWGKSVYHIIHALQSNPPQRPNFNKETIHSSL